MAPQVEKIHQDVQENLTQWRLKLKAVDARKSKDLGIKQLERDFRHQVCRLEDIFETLSNKVQSRRGGGIKEYLTKLTGILGDSKSFQEVKEINNKLTNIYSVFESKLVKAINSGEDESHAANENQERLSHRNTPVREVYTDWMGEIFLKLESVMDDMLLRHICLYGMGGIGKTALAQKVYNHPSIVRRFDIRAWVCIGQEYSKGEVYRNILNQLWHRKANELDEMELHDTIVPTRIYESLKGRRYLIVFDDIWSMDFWDGLKRIFPNDGNGSKLIFTTRLREVATYVAGDERDGFIHAMEFLSASESSKLFWKTAFSGNLGEVDPLKEQIGEEVLKLCGGLPSAIIAVGQVLATKHNLRDWETVLRDTKSLISRGMPVDQIVLEQSISALSYDDLPYHLKRCFHYLGLFPKGSSIEVEKLYLLWIAEPVISEEVCQNNETMMDLAERYLSELLERKMVEVEEEDTPCLRKYRSCRVHEQMQDHCFLKGEEHFFKVVDVGLRIERREHRSTSSLTSDSARRLAVHLSKQDDRADVDQFKNETFNHLWSLLLLNLHDVQMKLELPQAVSDLKKFRMLKILKFEGIDFQERDLPTGLRKLTYVRYLSFRGCILGELPSSIGDLSSLEILDLQVLSLIILPNALNKLEKLRYLYLPLNFKKRTNDKLRLGNLIELEILENFHAGKCVVADLFKMKNLRQLSMIVEGDLEDLEQTVNRLNMIPEHENILHPSITVKHFDCYTEERHSVFRKLLSCAILHTLCMDGHLGQIPPSYKITTSLTHIVLKGSQLKEDPMATFEKLPKVQVMVLQEDAVIVKKMTCSASGFRELKRLELLTLNLLETWEVEDDAMPNLSALVIKNCSKLETVLPYELRFRHARIKVETDDGSEASSPQKSNSG